MTPGEQYRLKSAELEAKAQESEPHLRAELQQLARSYLRLAAEADRKSQVAEGESDSGTRPDPASGPR